MKLKERQSERYFFFQSADPESNDVYVYGVSFNFVSGISGCIPAFQVSSPMVDFNYSTVSATAFFADANFESTSL